MYQNDRFEDRWQAGIFLADKLRQYKNSDALVLAIPRGGVPLGFVIARELHLPLDIALSKKIGHPYSPEFAIGSVSLHGRVLNTGAKVPAAYVEQETRRIRAMLNRRHELYMGNRPSAAIKNKIVILVDDGIATGNTMRVTIDLLRQQQPRHIVLAIPVAPQQTLHELQSRVDEIVCLMQAQEFVAVGQYYESFHQISDAEVVHLLREALRDESHAGKQSES